MSVLRAGTQEPKVNFTHYTEANESKIFASWHMEQLVSKENYFIGPIADVQSLYEASAVAGIECAAVCIEEYAKRLSNL